MVGLAPANCSIHAWSRAFTEHVIDDHIITDYGVERFLNTGDRGLSLVMLAILTSTLRDSVRSAVRKKEKTSFRFAYFSWPWPIKRKSCSRFRRQNYSGNRCPCLNEPNRPVRNVDLVERTSSGRGWSNSLSISTQHSGASCRRSVSILCMPRA